jgi:integrase
VEAFNCVAAGWGLTGGREGEVLGLELDDLSFERGVVTFRPNEWRRLKTCGSHRPMPLWPQLAEVLRPYADRRVVERGGTLLFPCWTGGMVTDWRKTRDRVAERAGWKAGEIRSKRFRHTYCAPRLQTLDHGAPVSVYTVSRELGHGSTAMVEKVYSHLGSQRHRSAVVEYRAEQHASILGGRLTALGPRREGENVTRDVTELEYPAQEPEGKAGVSSVDPSNCSRQGD